MGVFTFLMPWSILKIRFFKSKNNQTKGGEPMKLQELQEHFFHLYGRRNRIFFSGRRERIDFLNLAIGDLQEAIRKETDAKNIRIALARVVSRIFCITESFWSLSISEAMSQKYPSGYCAYCQTSPCSCPERRPGILLQEPSSKQLNWSLAEWCQHFETLYGQRNKDKGIENLLNRLFKEISELLSLEMSISDTKWSLDKIEEEFALEMADALAWTIAVANYVEIDLEEAVFNRYGNGCGKCGQNPCFCTGFSFSPIKWS